MEALPLSNGVALGQLTSQLPCGPERWLKLAQSHRQAKGSAPQEWLPCPSAGSAPLYFCTFGRLVGLLQTDVLGLSRLLWPSGPFLPLIRDSGGITLLGGTSFSSKAKGEKAWVRELLYQQGEGTSFLTCWWLWVCRMAYSTHSQVRPCFPALLRSRGQVSPMTKVKSFLGRTVALQLENLQELGGTKLGWLLLSFYWWAPEVEERLEELQSPSSPQSKGSNQRDSPFRTHGMIGYRIPTTKWYL